MGTMDRRRRSARTCGAGDMCDKWTLGHALASCMGLNRIHLVFAKQRVGAGGSRKKQAGACSAHRRRAEQGPRQATTRAGLKHRAPRSSHSDPSPSDPPASGVLRLPPPRCRHSRTGKTPGSCDPPGGRPSLSDASIWLLLGCRRFLHRRLCYATTLLGHADTVDRRDLEHSRQPALGQRCVCRPPSDVTMTLHNGVRDA